MDPESTGMYELTERQIEAAIDFLKKGGERVIITTPEYLIFALDGKAGTLIVRK